jgi:hypothetical protein
MQKVLENWNRLRVKYRCDQLTKILFWNISWIVELNRDNCVLHGKIYLLIRILSTFSKLMWPLWHSRKYQFNSTIQEMFQNSIFVNWSHLYSTLNLLQLMDKKHVLFHNIVWLITIVFIYYSWWIKTCPVL